MKFKYCFVIILIVTILFSLTSAAASENITGDIPSLDSSLADDVISHSEDSSNKLGENKGISNNPSSIGEGEDNIDLSVSVDFKNVQIGNEINCVGFEIPWTITVKVNNGTAHDVKVKHQMSKKMEFVSGNTTKGVFDMATGIWDIGDLTSSDNATLKLLTKLNANGTHSLILTATTSSPDIDTSNNYLRVPLQSGKAVGNSSNVTKTSKDKKHVDHSNKHQQSTTTTATNQRKKDKHQQSTTTTATNQRKKEDSTKDNENEGQSASKSISKSILNDNNNAGSSITQTVMNTLNSIFNPDEDSNSTSEGDLSGDVAKTIPAYDYTKIPLIIFSVFILLLIAIVGYDKIKS